MHYRQAVAAELTAVIEHLTRIEEHTEACPSHRLDSFASLIERLTAIRADLEGECGLLAATRKAAELHARLAGSVWGLADPKYRSTLARLLGSHQANRK